VGDGAGYVRDRSTGHSQQQPLSVSTGGQSRTLQNDQKKDAKPFSHPLPSSRPCDQFQQTNPTQDGIVHSSLSLARAHPGQPGNLASGSTSLSWLPPSQSESNLASAVATAPTGTLLRDPSSMCTSKHTHTTTTTTHTRNSACTPVHPHSHLLLLWVATPRLEALARPSLVSPRTCQGEGRGGEGQEEEAIQSPPERLWFFC